MAKKIKRRQFGQIAAGSFTTTLLSQFSAKVLSATAQELVYGVNLLDTSQLQDLENNTPPLELVQTDLTAQQVPVKIKVNSVKVKNTKPVKKKIKPFFSLIITEFQPSILLPMALLPLRQFLNPKPAMSIKLFLERGKLINLKSKP